MEAIGSAIRERRYFAALLRGVTGSGKTEVYLRAIRAALEAGRGAIWLVPEIVLTPVFARELRRHFPDQAAVLHSALSERERGEAWDRALRRRSRRDRAAIAAFAPVADPGLRRGRGARRLVQTARVAPYDAREVALRA
jgi:primosomal protein N' (replication factor Y)